MVEHQGTIAAQVVQRSRHDRLVVGEVGRPLGELVVGDDRSGWEGASQLGHALTLQHEVELSGTERLTGLSMGGGTVGGGTVGGGRVGHRVVPPGSRWSAALMSAGPGSSPVHRRASRRMK